ncbi:hypothetical protein Clacol_001200 [Clathrus columnatus]|uniref:Uncharacterized protein n=1 Tax=Clathrus columnatus TaxID=1419009 RepID=A0AAV5A0Q0_9AGAM|nr:hypothetical protein Clacol_001200 [Clathrus columnatus]
MPSKVVALSRGGLSFKFTCVTNESLKYFVTKNGVETEGLKTKIVDEMIIEVKPRKTTITLLVGFLGFINLAFKAMPKSSLPELLKYEKKALFWRASNSFTFKLHVPGYLEYEGRLLNASTVLSSGISSESTRPQITSLTFQIPFPLDLPLKETPKPNGRVNNPISQRQRRPDIDADKRLSSRSRRIENLDSRLSPNTFNVSTCNSDIIERLQSEIKELREFLERKEKRLKLLLCKGSGLIYTMVPS